MKTHKVKDPGIASRFDGEPDWFTTYCGLSSWNNPSEELTENLVGEHDECTCKVCRKAYDHMVKNAIKAESSKGYITKSEEE